MANGNRAAIFVLWISCLIFSAGCGSTPEIASGGPTAEWEVYGRSSGGARYSPLTQITPENVGHLEVAWLYHTGDVSEGGPER